jgi:Uma2 family endonuclease
MMASASRIRQGISLEEFLEDPTIDRRPYLEYIDGRIEARIESRAKQSVLAKRMTQRLDEFARRSGLGEAFPMLRCTFAGYSMVPSVVFQLSEHIDVDESGMYEDRNPHPPDVHIELMSPKESTARVHRKLLRSTANGCPLGLRINPERETIDVYRPGIPVERLRPESLIDFGPVLSGLQISVAEVFGWLVYRRSNEDSSQGPGAVSP